MIGISQYLNNFGVSKRIGVMCLIKKIPKIGFSWDLESK